jgi:broad specificity phosphatase PhoE
MKTTSWIAAIIAVVAFVVISIISWCSTTTIYIVRHAEKDSLPANDPVLNVAGQQRAVALADLLEDKSIAYIYSTNTTRTQSTAQPLSKRIGVPVTIYNDVPGLVSSLQFADRRNILIVGHSNTILDIFSALGGTPSRTIIEDSDFDNLLIVSKHRYFFITWTTCSESTYGAATPP